MFVILFVSVPVFQSMFGVINFYGKILKRVKNVCDSSPCLSDVDTLRL